jgi:glycosyltransferase involved in cell wall biosynthesis
VPRVTVVLAALDGARYIDEQLRSIATQTLPPHELIVGDDGSSDGTPDIVERFASTASFPVRLFRRPTRLGYSENFLQGARAATGDLIAFSDQDDVWLPTKLERTSRQFDDLDVMLCVHDVHVVGPDLLSTARRLPNLGLISRLHFADRLFVPHGSRSVIRTELLEICPPEERPVTMYTWDDDYLQEHDEWAFFAASAAGTVRHLRDRLSYFRRHAGALGFTAETSNRGARATQLAPRSDRQTECLARGARARAAYLRTLVERDPSGQRSARFAAEAQNYDSVAALMDGRRAWLGGPWKERAIGASSAIVRRQYRSQAGGGLGSIALGQDIRALLPRQG